MRDLETGQASCEKRAEDALTGNHRGRPKISVIVFSRNAVATIGQTLESVCGRQSGDGIELLVLDGGSTDGTVEVIRRYENKIAFWRSAPDGGPTNAINEGIARATGDVICLLPADDWLEPGALEAIGSEFAADPDLEVLSCGARYVRFGKGGVMRVEMTFVSPEILAFNLPNVLLTPLTANRMIRRSVYQRIGGHSPDIGFGDYDFLVRLCLSRPKSRVLPRLVYTYRRHPGSRTLSGSPDSVLAMLEDGIKMVESYLARADLGKADRRALLRQHGRASAHYAWRLFRRGEFLSAAGILLHAMRMSWLWPIRALGWMLQALRKWAFAPKVN